MKKQNPHINLDNLKEKNGLMVLNEKEMENVLGSGKCPEGCCYKCGGWRPGMVPCVCW